MSDTPEGMVHATFVGAAPRHYPTLGLTLVPGEECDIPEGVAHELSDVFEVARKKAPKPSATETTTTEGED